MMKQRLLLFLTINVPVLSVMFIVFQVFGLARLLMSRPFLKMRIAPLHHLESTRWEVTRGH